MRASCVRGRRSMAKTTRTPRTMANPIAVVAITLPRSGLLSLIGIFQDSQISHIAKVPAQAIASMTTKGTGISSSSPEALKIARAASAKAIPTSAQTIQDGKYEPKILREGAPSQPPNKPSIGAAHHNRAAGAKRRHDLPRSGEFIAIFMRRQCHRFIHRQQSPLWGRAASARVGRARIANADRQKMPECGGVVTGWRRQW